MPITTIYPATTAADTDFPPNAGASASDALKDSSDGSWCSKQAYTGESHSCNGGNTDDLPASASTVNSVQPVARAQGQSGSGNPNGGANLQGGVRIAGTNYDAFGQNLRDGDGLQEFNGTVYTINPNTGLAWTVADVNSLSWWTGANNYHFDGDIAFVMQLRFVVDYNTGSPSTGRAQGAIIVG